MDIEELAAIVNGFENAYVIVVGDFCLDAYLIHDPELGDKVSVETGQAPFSVFERRYSPGGAGNVSVNITALGGICDALGVIGNGDPKKDGEGLILASLLGNRGVTELLLRTERNTPTYSKPVHAHTREESPRIDIVNTQQVEDKYVDLLLDRLADQLVKPEYFGCAVIVNDQIKMGISAPYFIERITALRSKFPSATFLVDSRRHAAEYAKPGMMLKLNSFEAVNLLEQSEYQDPLQKVPQEAVFNALPAIWRRTGSTVFITRGEDGMIVYHGQEPVVVPAIPLVEPFDTCGGGDTAIATLALYYASQKNPDPVKAAYIANAAANITCQQVGTTGVATPKQVIENLSYYAAK